MLLDYLFPRGEAPSSAPGNPPYLPPFRVLVGNGVRVADVIICGIEPITPRPSVRPSEAITSFIMQ
jgi:hypothetical protein